MFAPEASAEATHRPTDFTLTRWTLVLRAGTAPASTDGAAALAWLCERYWYPLYALARRYGRDPAAAQDSTQEFFLGLIERSKLAQADPERGRFRNWLRKCFENHLKQEDARQRTVKRGGRHPHFSLDAVTAEERYRLEPRDPRTPEASFDEAWITALTEAALAELEAEYTRLGKADLFRELRPFLTGEQGSYADLGARIGQSTNTARVTVHRLRQRYHELYQAELAQTVGSEQELAEEQRHLHRVLFN